MNFMYIVAAVVGLRVCCRLFIVVSACCLLKVPTSISFFRLLYLSPISLVMCIDDRTRAH